MNLGSLDHGAFVVGFPIIGSFLQCLLLPLVYDSPVSLGLIWSNKLFFTIPNHLQNKISNLDKASQRKFDKSRKASKFYGIAEVIDSEIDNHSLDSTSRPETQSFLNIIRDPLFFKPLIVCCIMMMIGFGSSKSIIDHMIRFVWYE